MKTAQGGGSSRVFSRALNAVACRLGGRGGDQPAHFVDAAIAGGVDFDNVHCADRALANLAAGVTHAAGFRHRVLGGTAVQRHGQDSGNRGLSNTAMPAENVAVSDALLLKGVLQGAGHVVLTDHVRESLRAVLARQNGVAHEESIIPLTCPNTRTRAACGCRKAAPLRACPALV